MARDEHVHAIVFDAVHLHALLAIEARRIRDERFDDEMAATVRSRAEHADEVAERTVRGWLRRPKPQPT